MAHKLKSTTDIIDLNEWVTQARYAAITGYKLGTISQWVKRVKDNEGSPRIDIKDVPELGITLVRKRND